MDFDNELRKVAKRYQDEGYEVVVRPKGDAVPSFAAGYEPDLIARNGSENVVAEVKQNRAMISSDPKITRLAEVTNAQPGWRFDLVILESESPLERVRRSSQEPTHQQIEERLARAERIADSGEFESAFVVGWACLEAAMRWLASEAKLYGRPLPIELLEALYSNGLVTSEEFDTLRSAYDLRTQLVHGFLPTGVDRQTIENLIAIARKTLAGEPKQAELTET
jgi:uncharacterized protein YutE (UPF0331/DUF86 family)